MARGRVPDLSLVRTDSRGHVEVHWALVHTFSSLEQHYPDAAGLLQFFFKTPGTMLDGNVQASPGEVSFEARWVRGRVKVRATAVTHWKRVNELVDKYVGPELPTGDLYELIMEYTPFIGESMGNENTGLNFELDFKPSTPEELVLTIAQLANELCAEHDEWEADFDREVSRVPHEEYELARKIIEDDSSSRRVLRIAQRGINLIRSCARPDPEPETSRIGALVRNGEINAIERAVVELGGPIIQRDRVISRTVTAMNYAYSYRASRAAQGTFAFLWLAGWARRKPLMIRRDTALVSLLAKGILMMSGIDELVELGLPSRGRAGSVLDLLPMIARHLSG
jgi:hypothetical protein